MTKPQAQKIIIAEAAKRAADTGQEELVLMARREALALSKHEAVTLAQAIQSGAV